jgi:hypothetical protein
LVQAKASAFVSDILVMHADLTLSGTEGENPAGAQSP